MSRTMSRTSRKNPIETKFSGCMGTIERYNYVILYDHDIAEGKVRKMGYIAYEFNAS